MSSKIRTYVELQRMIRKALREQHPEWIDANGRCAPCDSYEARFARLLRIFARRAAELCASSSAKGDLGRSWKKGKAYSQTPKAR